MLKISIMNNSKLVDRQIGDQWVTVSTGAPGKLAPGITLIPSAQYIPPTSTASYSGIILHIDREHIYQQVGPQKFAQHLRRAFKKLPCEGDNILINYRTGQGEFKVT